MYRISETQPTATAPEKKLPSLTSSVTSRSTRSKITLNVIDIINNRSRETERVPGRETKELLNKKNRIYQSRSKLPTLQDLLETEQDNDEK